MKRTQIDQELKIIEILKKHIKATPLSVEEHGILKNWLEESESNQKLFKNLGNEESLAESIKMLYNTNTENLLKKFQQRVRLKRLRKQKKNRIKWLSAAACLIAVLSIGYYIAAIRYKGDQTLNITSQFGDEALPGSNRAILTLSNGKAVSLNDHNKGISNQAGKIFYEGGEELLSLEDAQIGVLKTPNGGQYKITLEDGTKVWLNASSSLEYPIKFQGNSREVRISGEAYFEVAHNKDKPFIVSSKGQKVKVLGTSFNVRNYDGMEQTTLLTGRVSITSEIGNKQIQLIPGQQSIVFNGKSQVRNVDVSDFSSWKDGFFAGSSMSLQYLTKDIERWYDVQFVYPQNFNNSEKAYLHLNRNEKLSSVLKALEKTYGVSFRIKGKEVIVQ
ncbi:FecR family protein [Chryseobacterium defluvii]|uniref:FecR family protein n=1 Tax=Chryseobacterium defluvii TaxID=160396 RepID=A0A495SQT8_9FLAO|nr:FecR family protein [Chryseobacterium defluvii]RKT01754.1 FecR family protein [Chryseobacterium defluvii]